MSLPTSKSKTQLAYARSTKPTNKPKSKNSLIEAPDTTTKTRNPPRNSTGNIYDSIMGQIEPKQQDYIKSLIVKSQKEARKEESRMGNNNGEKDGDNFIPSNKNENKKSLNNSMVINSPPTASVLKVHKQHQTHLKKPSTLGVHQRTRSQAQLIIKDSEILTSSIETTKSIVQPHEQKKMTEISCNDSQGEVFEGPVSSKGSRVKVLKQSSSKEILLKVNHTTGMGEGLLEKVQTNNGNAKEMMVKKQSPTNPTMLNKNNPIIQALNNTSSSFAKKLQVFELQYPYAQERQQRSTHKKVPSKLSVQYFSCQTSPKNNKNIYTKQIIVTTKPTNKDYQQIINRQQQVSANISPISSTKNSNQKNHKRPAQSTEPIISTNFISCLDEYLQALTYNSAVSENVQQNLRPMSNNVNMKRSNSSKFREFSASKGQPFTLGEEEQEEQEEQTVVMGNGAYTSNANSKLKIQSSNSTQLLSYSQQQKIIKQLAQQRKKVSELNSIIQMFHQQLAKYKKKEKKLKQNQYDMIAVMKELNEQLTEEKNQRRKLQGVVNEFQWKIRGISRGKEKGRRDSGQIDQRPQRKTIYGTSSMGNSIHFHHNQKNSSKLQKHSKKPSFNRLSSMINSVNCNNQNCHDDMSYEPSSYYENNLNSRLQSEGFFKNKTQKFSKIISNFELENQPCDEEDEMYFRSRNFNHNNNGRKTNKQRQQVILDSLKQGGYPTSCKHSYMNSSMPLSTKSKSRPMTPKLVEDLFRSNKSKNHEYHTKNYSSSQDEEERYQDTSREYKERNFDEDGGYGEESEVRETEMSVDEEVMEGDGGYQIGVMKRMR